MNVFRTVIVLSTVLALLLSACGGKQEIAPTPEPVEIELTGMLSNVSGEVLARQEGQEEYEVPFDGYINFKNGHVSTGNTGSVSLNVADGSNIWLGNNSFLSMEPAMLGEELQTNLDLGRGEVLAALNGGSLVVNTSAGVARVEGSVILVNYLPGYDLIRVLCFEGKLWFQDRQ